jgi:hypothetical protein
MRGVDKAMIKPFLMGVIFAKVLSPPADLYSRAARTVGTGSDAVGRDTTGEVVSCMGYNVRVVLLRVWEVMTHGQLFW